MMTWTFVGDRGLVHHTGVTKRETGIIDQWMGCITAERVHRLYWGPQDIASWGGYFLN